MKVIAETLLEAPAQEGESLRGHILELLEGFKEKDTKIMAIGHIELACEMAKDMLEPDLSGDSYGG